jgi:menaquinone-dependent protoporphyrinogen oxidase
MKRIVILYATREGQTRKIAEHLKVELDGLGLAPEIFDVAGAPAPVLDGCAAAIVAGSVHLGKHEKELVRYVTAHRTELALVPTSIFLSVSMAEAGAEDMAKTAERRAEAQTEAWRAIARFLHETDWKPTRSRPVAGALRYTQYGPVTRFVMKRIAKRNGNDLDTTRDHEYTDWGALDTLATELAGEVEAEVT